MYVDIGKNNSVFTYRFCMERIPVRLTHFCYQIMSAIGISFQRMFEKFLKQPWLLIAAPITFQSSHINQTSIESLGVKFDDDKIQTLKVHEDIVSLIG